jgi:hypothetical protein
MEQLTRADELPEAEDPESVEIPGDTTLWKTQSIPSKRIYLPLEAYGRFSWHILGFGVAGAFAAYYAISFYNFSAENWNFSSLSEKTAWTAETVGCLFITVLFLGMSTRMMFDSSASWPVLILNGQGL